MPLIPFIVFAAFLAAWYFHEQRRRRGLRELATKLNLEINPDHHIAPEPYLGRFVYTLRYKSYLQGRIRGVAVVAFDYQIGWNRRRQYGSCVGIHRNVLTVLSAPSDLVLSHVGGWSFLYSESTWMTARNFTADDIEQLWDHLLVAPAEGLERASTGMEVPGGLVIRPVKMGQQ